MVLIDLDALECPLCAEQLDATELCLRHCECDYKICLFCYQRLVDDAAARRLQLADYYRETYRSKPGWQGV